MKGCHKRVIYMKNTGSDVFEEAYFVVKDGGGSLTYDGDFLSEAKRIVEENKGIGARKRGEGAVLQRVLIFGSGFLLAFLIALLIFFAA